MLPQPSFAVSFAVRRPGRRRETVIERAPRASTLLTRRLPIATLTTDRSEIVNVSLALRTLARALSRLSRGLSVSGAPTMTLAFILGWMSHRSAKLPG